MGRALVIEVKAVDPFDLEDDAEYSQATAMQRIAFEAIVRKDVAEYFHKNLSEDATVDVTIRVSNETDEGGGII